MLSGKIEFRKILSANLSLKLSVSSLSNAPNISELYGSYQRAAIVSVDQTEMTASIKGNSELAYMFYVELGNLGDWDTEGNYISSEKNLMTFNKCNA